MQIAESLTRKEPAKAREIIAEVTKSIDENDWKNRLYVYDLKMEMLMIENKHQEAYDIYDQDVVKYIKNFDPEMRSREIYGNSRYIKMNQKIPPIVNAIKSGKTVMSVPTNKKPTQAPRRTPVPVQNKQKQPEAQPKTIGEKFTALLEKVKSAEFWKKFGNDLMAGKYLGIIGGIIAFILVFWWVPRKLMMLFLRQGNPKAPIWYPRVRKWGMAAFMIFILKDCKNWVKHYKESKQKKLETQAKLMKGMQPNATAAERRDYMKHLAIEVEKTIISRKSKKDEESSAEKDAMKRLIDAVFSYVVMFRGTDLHLDMEIESLTMPLSRRRRNA